MNDKEYIELLEDIIIKLLDDNDEYDIVSFTGIHLRNAVFIMNIFNQIILKRKHES